MKAVIMAGGFGTRLRPLTQNIPKPMVPLMNKPMMEHIVSLLKRHNIKDLIVLLFFQGDVIENYFKDGKDFGVDIRYIIPTEDYGTAGAVKLAEEYIDDTFLVISADVLTDFNLNYAIDFHKKRKADATILLTRVENPLPFGIVITEQNGRIKKFLEKPSWGEVFSDTINTGIYILEKEVLQFIPKNKEFDFSKDLFPLMMSKKKKLFGADMEGYWKDVGNLTEYRLAHLDVLDSKVNIEIPLKKINKRLFLGEGSKVDYTVTIEGLAVVGNNCKIEKNVTIRNSVIGNNSVIEEGSKILDSVIWDGVFVGRLGEIKESVVGSNTVIKEGAHLSEEVVVADTCTIGRFSLLKPGVKVWPMKTVEDGAILASSLIWGESWSKSIFGPYGVCGLANFEITPEFAAKLGAAYGATFKKGDTIATSRDHHPASRMINRAFMTGVLSTGVNVHDYGVIPVSVARFLTRTFGETGGIYTRKSPFDPDIIDMKFYEERGIDIGTNKEKTIERFFFGEDFRRVGIEDTGRISFPSDFIENYKRGFLNNINVSEIMKRKFKIVIDFSHGSASNIFPSILGKLDCELVALNANLESSKLTKTKPEFENSLTQLSNIVRSIEADLGVFLDAGGEKIYLIDERGEIYNGVINLLTILTMLIQSNRDIKKIAVPVNASMAVEDIAKKYDIETVRTKTSNRAIMESALMESLYFVGENYGGYVFPNFLPAFDGMYSIIKVLECLAKLKTSLYEIKKTIPYTYLISDTIPCSWEKKGLVMRYLVEKTNKMNVELIDGIKVKKDTGWYLAIPSPDKAYFNIFAESYDRKGAEELINEIRKIVMEGLEA
ncbi:MAG: mannose-1-phosphate guanyltransferase [Proteobacteria bacterium]|nr:mannose-1-phosphate guanyltransferase [Pseudomonadota bacterium]